MSAQAGLDLNPSAIPLDEARPLQRAATLVRESSQRLPCVDILRGVVMVLMTLDHTRDFFSADQFAPEDISHTTAAIFFTRGLTHFCAPAFFLLAGMGAGLSLARGRPKSEVSQFLWTRGLWLVILNLTLIPFGWTFGFPLFSGVLWAIGWSMFLLAFLINLPVRWIAAFSVVLIAFHNLLDQISPASLGILGPLWLVFYGYGAFWIVPGQLPFTVLWSIFPWVGVMAGGLALSFLLSRDDWQRIFFRLGFALTTAFLLLRGLNLYGNSEVRLFGVAAGPWSVQPTLGLTVASFCNTLKYPASLDFLLMTVGPILLGLACLGFAEPSGAVSNFLSRLGRVPLFFYVIHLYVIHLVAIAAAIVCKEPWQWLLHGSFMTTAPPPGYGYPLAVIYLFTAGNVLLTYPICLCYLRLKRAKPDWVVLRYL